jgi:uncharacterized protein YggT (Ycf19 family)
MQDDKVAVDEARRTAQHASVKSKVEGDVNAEIAGKAAHPTASQTAKIDEAAGKFRLRAIDETVAVEREVGRARGAARGSQVIDYVFYVAYALLAIRLVLALIAARSGNGFVRFINAVTWPLYAPFRGIVPSPTTEGGYTLAVPIMIAIGVWALLHLAINGLLRMFAHRKTEI